MALKSTVELRKRRRTTSPKPRARKRYRPATTTVPALKTMIRERHVDALMSAIVRNQTTNAVRRAHSARSLSALVNIANKTSLLEALGMSTSTSERRANASVETPAVTVRRSPAATTDWRTVDASKRFQLKKKIGQGNFGSVWKAVDRADGRTYALKILPQMDNESKREVALLKRFSADSAACHRNVICYQDMFEIKVSGKRQFAIQMEFIDGLPLDKWHQWWFANNSSPPPAYVARKLATDLFAAVSAIHKQRVYHLDIKPSNIMLRKQGQDAVLVDFGLSCTAKAARTNPDTCVDTDGNGTPHYMSPDYLQNCAFPKTFSRKCNEDVRRYTDIWASGLTLWCVLHPGNAVKELFARFDEQDLSESRLPAWLRAQSIAWQRSVMYPLDAAVNKTIQLALNSKKSKTTSADDLLKMVH